MATTYTVVTADAPVKLISEVNALIEQGWQPFGGVSITLSGPRQEGQLTMQGTILAQALIR